MTWLVKLLDWHLRRLLAAQDLPDLPETRRLMRLAWWNGFTFGALERRMAAARTGAREATREALGRRRPHG